MSDNVGTTKDLHINCGIEVATRETVYDIQRFKGMSPVTETLTLRGWEAVLIPLLILKDALHREEILKEIYKPLNEDLAKLKALIEPMQLIPHELRSKPPETP